METDNQIKPKTGKTKLVVTIYEDGTGNFEVEREASIAETGERIHMRPSHVVGQLQTAIYLLQAETYATLKPILEKQAKDLSKKPVASSSDRNVTR